MAHRFWSRSLAVLTDVNAPPPPNEKFALTTLAASPPPDTLRSRLRPTCRTAVSALALCVLVLVPEACSGPRSVEHVTVVNPTAYDLDVDVTGARRDGWLAVGHVHRDSDAATEHVIDQGGTWIFRFRHEGRDAGELQISRGDLRRNRWRLVIPPSLGERLRELGFEPSAESDGR